VNAPGQLAMPAFLEQRHSFQEQLLARVRGNLAELDRQLARQNACSRLAVEGGWYVALRVPAIRSDEDLALELLTSKNVYVHPGHFYDFPSADYLIATLLTAVQQFEEGMKILLSSF